MTRSSRTVYKNSELLPSRLAQKKSKIDSDYQKQINFLLKNNNLGLPIEEDGVWGDATQDALNKIQNHFKLKPFDSVESLDQLNSTIQSSLSPEAKGATLNQTGSPPLAYMLQDDQIIGYLSNFEKIFNNFKEYLAATSSAKFRDTADKSIKYYESRILYLKNLIYHTDILSNIEVFSKNFSEISSMINEALNRDNVFLDLYKKISEASASKNEALVNQLTTSLIEKQKIPVAFTREQFFQKISQLLQHSKRIVNL